MPRFHEIKDYVKSGVSYGLMGNLDRESGIFDYMAGYEYTHEGAIPKGMETWDVPAQRYAVFTATLPTLLEVFDFIYKDWLPNSEFQREPGVEFELYDETFNPQDGSSILYLYIPVL